MKIVIPNQDTFNFLTSDFEETWEALVKRATERRGNGLSDGGGLNYGFALIAMILLEFGCRLCGKGTNSIGTLENELRRVEMKYFTQIPGVVRLPKEFDFPAPADSLLAFLFDVIRNGKAHHYESIDVTVSNGTVIAAIAGPNSKRSIKSTSRRRSRKHLRYKLYQNNLLIYVRPDQLFLDFKKAIKKSGILA
jgi:hypothetical protein